MQGMLWAVPLGHSREDLASISSHSGFSIKPEWHITLAFGVCREDVSQHLGSSLHVKVVRRVVDNETGLDALQIELPEGTLFRGKVPHLTLSHRVNVKPKLSTAMLLSSDFNEGWFSWPLELDMVIVFVPFAR